MITDTKTVLLYLVYGKENTYNQVLFSLLTLYYHHQNKIKETLIIVYTDNPSYFKKYESAFNIKFELLTPQIIEEHKGKYNFIHRIKICVIKECIEKYKANILYLDSDTYFTASPTLLLNQINESTSLMNSDDYDLQCADDLYENMDWLQIRKSIRNFSYKVNDSNIKIPLTTRMWNAGVIGIAYKNKHLVSSVLDLTDQIYKNKKVFTAEQFAFSYFLQNNTTLISSGDVIMHYWPNHVNMYWKDAYDETFKIFFKKNNGKSIEEISKQAYLLTLRHENIIKSYKETLTKKVLRRWKLLKSIIIKGKV